MTRRQFGVDTSYGNLSPSRVASHSFHTLSSSTMKYTLFINSFHHFVVFMSCLLMSLIKCLKGHRSQDLSVLPRVKLWKMCVIQVLTMAETCLRHSLDNKQWEDKRFAVWQRIGNIRRRSKQPVTLHEQARELPLSR